MSTSITLKYGQLTDTQFTRAIKDIQNKIFYLLLIVDPKTKDNYPNINVNDALDDAIQTLFGFNELLEHPKELVKACAKLEAARLEYNKSDFSYKIYRKLILDSGNELARIKEVL